MPRLDNRPLLGTTADEPLFVAPPGLDRLAAAVERDLNALVIGPPGSGKTTILRELAARRHGAARPPVYVDLGSATTAAQALMLIADALDIRGAVDGWASQNGASAPLLRLVRRLGEAPPALLLADNPPQGGEAHTIFGSLRDELWQLDHRWVVAAGEHLRDELTRPPAGAFFDVKAELGPLPPELQSELLSRRLNGEVDLSALVGATDGLPRSVIELARETVLSGAPVADVLEQREAFERRVAALPPAARAAVDHLAAHGAASASDAGLLAALGSSPQRARVVLKQLEDAGVVRSYAQQQDRRGRPRKLYELV